MKPSKQNNLTLEMTHNQEINSMLSPIFQAVRNNKINSYYQFRKFSSSDQNNRNASHHIFAIKNHPNKINQSNTISYSHKNQSPNKVMAKTFFIQRSNNAKNKTSAQNRMNATAHTFLNRNSAKTPSSLRTVNTREYSKIKKHLVESIDFEEIQKMLYKKREWVTRYQHFYQKLKNNYRKKENIIASRFDQEQINVGETIQPSVTLNVQKKIVSKDKNAEIKVTMSRLRELTPDLEDSCRTTPLRRTPRKKFWAKDGISLNSSPHRVKPAQNPQISQLIKGKQFSALKIASNTINSNDKQEQINPV